MFLYLSLLNVSNQFQQNTRMKPSHISFGTSLVRILTSFVDLFSYFHVSSVVSQTSLRVCNTFDMKSSVRDASIFKFYIKKTFIMDVAFET